MGAKIMDLEDYKHLFSKLASLENLGFCYNQTNSLDQFMPILSKIREDSSVVVIKLDGERSDDIYTLLISGEKLGADGYIRIDTSDLESGLAFICVKYASQVWGIDL